MKKKIISIILVLILPVILFCGCSNSKSDKGFEGEICVLEFKEEYTTRTPITTIIWTGKTAVPITTWYVRTYPDRWYVKVRRFNTDKQEYEYDECYVTKECFDKLKIGDWFIYNSDYCFDEEPYTQKKD